MKLAENDKSLIQQIYNLKKDIFNLRIKKSSGDTIKQNSIRSLKKEIARIFTKINAKK